MKNAEQKADDYCEEENGGGNALPNRAMGLLPLRQHAREVYRSAQRLFRDLDDLLRTETEAMRNG